MAFPKIDGYVVTEKLGSGSYSTVYKAYNKVGGRSTVAVKCIDKSRVKHSSSAVDNLISEIRLLKTLSHPHIVHMKHFDWDDRNIYIIMEFCCGGDLSKYIHRYGRVPEPQVLYFLQQLASALKFLREKNVVHMDLKPHNLLLHKGSDGKYILKVADFGFAQHMSAEWARAVRGSPLYMAPEMLAGEYDERVDLWSVGVIMYECLFGRAPYSSNTFKELIDKIHRQAPIEIPRGAAISGGCLELLTGLLRHRPDERISYEEFFSHPYLDLEHMPSKDNYEKAVCLIKRAIELDASGQLREAFAAYRDSLRYLVPAVRAEADALRRGALAAKLTRYMERAEEIKIYLKHGESLHDDQVEYDPRAGQAEHTVHDPRAGHASHDVSMPANGQCCVQYDPAARAGITPRPERTAEEPTDAGARDPPADQRCARDQEHGPRRASERTRTPPRFALRRLFGRQAAVPYLSKEDASITQDTSEHTQKQTAGEPAGDGCRIN